MMSLRPLDFDDILPHIQEATGIPDLAPDETGSCALLIDNTFYVNIGFNGQSRQLVLFSHVGTLEEGETEKALALLRANNFWQGTGGGATLSLDEAGQAVMLAWQTPVYDNGLDELLPALEWFINLTEAWRARFGDLPTPNVSPDGAPVAAGMLKV